MRRAGRAWRAEGNGDSWVLASHREAPTPALAHPSPSLCLGYASLEPERDTYPACWP